MQQTPDDDAKRGPEQPSQPLYEYSTSSTQEDVGKSQAGQDKESSKLTTEAEQGELPAQSVAASEQYGPIPEASLEASLRPQEPSEEDIRQGLVYPPPPSFYLNMRDQPKSEPPLAPTPARVQPPAAPGEGKQPSVPFPPPTPLYGRVQAPPVAPGTALPPPVIPVARRRSNKWVWISLAIFGIIALLSCGLCSWAVSAFMGPIFTQTTGSLTTVNDYYAAIQKRDYADAYTTYIEPKGKLNGLTQSQFIAQAQERDTRYGQVLSFTPRTNQVSAQPGDQGLSSLSFTLDVTRSKLKYSVKVTVEKIGDKYKIVDYEQI